MEGTRPADGDTTGEALDTLTVSSPAAVGAGANAPPRLPDLDRSSPVPLYFQVAQRLEAAIASGVLTVGDRLDNEVALAQQYGVSRPTVRQAIAHLVDRGLLIRRRGIGTMVGPSTQVKRPLSLNSLYDDLTEAGLEPTTRVIGIGPVGATAEVARQLALPEGTQVTLIRRIRYARSEPIALMRTFLLDEFNWVTKASLEATGLYRLLRANGVDLRLANQSIGARAARPDEAGLLQMAPGAPLLTNKRTVFDFTGRPVEYSSHVYPADRYSFEMNLVSR